MRNRAAVWGWGGLALGLALAIWFAGRPAVAWLLDWRGSEEPAEAIPTLPESVSEKKFDRYLGLSAGVYSRYPFNNRDFIFLNRGSEDGVAVNSPVFGARGELLGIVREISRTRSQAETFWSPSWKSAVYVGDKKTKAVLRGGEIPVLEFLPKDSGVKAGDLVYNASPDFPLYAPIGKISKVSGGDQNPWFSGELEPFSEPGSLREIWILKNFP